MGALFAFFVGWAVGAKAGPKGYQEVLDAAKTVKESEEFGAFLAIARTHLAASLHELSTMVSGESPRPDPADLMERVTRLVKPRAT